MSKKPYDLDEQCLNEDTNGDNLQILNETIPATQDFKSQPDKKKGKLSPEDKKRK